MDDPRTSVAEETPGYAPRLVGVGLWILVVGVYAWRVLATGDLPPGDPWSGLTLVVLGGLFVRVPLRPRSRWLELGAALALTGATLWAVGAIVGS